MNAPKFDCSFYPTGNSAEVCTAERKAKATRVPTVPTDTRGTQTVTAERMIARFGQASGEIETMTAAGGVKFNERDRNATAQQMAFTESDGFVRFAAASRPIGIRRHGRRHARSISTRGRRQVEPAGRREHDLLRREADAAARTPFASSQKPVFVTADSADIDNANETALYRGSARGWQENNYVRADSLLIDQRSGRLTAEGNVQSTLFTTRSPVGGATTPVNASAGTLVYERDARVVRLRTNVDVRQGTERMTAESADILLDENFEVVKTVAQTNVVITQPGRRATGRSVEFTAADEVAVIRGEPATVTDGQNGSAQGAADDI